MCYFCHTLGNNSTAPNHRSARCTDPRNTYSTQTRSVYTSQPPPSYCTTCRCMTSRIWQQNNSHEAPWPRCLGCS